MLKNFRDWVRLAFFQRFDVVKARTLKRGKYYDSDMRMLHVNFQLLANFVEREMDFIDWTWKEEHIHAKAEMDDLYKWWKKYQTIKDPLYLYDGPMPCPWIDDDKEYSEGDKAKWEAVCDASNQFEEQREKEEEVNLIRLMKIRLYMWS